MTAPGLVQAYRKFKDRGVAFVSLTDVSRRGVEAFVEQHSIPWPCGYQSRLEDIAKFGAYTTERITPAFNPGTEVSPTLYLIGPDGRVLWNDGQARPRHLKDATALMLDLDTEIERALQRQLTAN